MRSESPTGLECVQLKTVFKRITRNEHKEMFEKWMVLKREDQSGNLI